MDDLLKAIIEHVEDDDSLRLAYAEKIADRDPDRAEFIRLQCSMTRCKLPETEAEKRRIRLRIRTLLDRNMSAWTADLTLGIPISDLPLKPFGFRRGFVEQICCTGKFFLAHAERLFQIAPIRSLQLMDKRGSQGLIAECPELQHIRDLSLGYTTFADLQLICRSFHLIRLVSLSVAGTWGDSGAREVAVAPWAHSLQQLYMVESRISDEGVAAIANANFRKLELLSLGGNLIGDVGAAALVASKNLDALRVLFLDKDLTITLLHRLPLPVPETVNPISPAWQQAIRDRFPNSACSFSTDQIILPANLDTPEYFI